MMVELRIRTLFLVIIVIGSIEAQITCADGMVIKQVIIHG